MPTTTRRSFIALALAAALAAAALLAAIPLPAAAATDEVDPTTWQVQPGGAEGPGERAYFVLEADPGTTLHDMVVITNLSEHDITMRVFGSDAYNAASGEFDLLASAETPTDVGAWTTIDPATVAADGSVTIPARSRLNLPFTIEIPANATPGDHVGGIVTSVPTARTTETGEQVLVDARVAARIYLAVRGDLVPRLQVGDVRAERTGEWWNPLDGEVEVTWTVTNTGNLRLAGPQEVTIEGPFGLGRVTVDAPALPEVLPGSSVEQTVTISGVPAAGLLTINGALQPVDTTGRVTDAIDPVSFAATLAAVPWPVIGLLVLLALIVWLVVRTIRRRRAAVRGLKAELAALKESQAGDSGVAAAGAGGTADGAAGAGSDAAGDGTASDADDDAAGSAGDSEGAADAADVPDAPDADAKPAGVTSGPS